MSDTKMYLLSAGVSLVCSALLVAAFSYGDKSSQIEVLAEQLKKPVYLNTQEKMNSEMAGIILPLLQKQHKEEEARKKIKKPDMVYAPEQLQNSRGY
ncbi:hypothetical protein JQ760_028820 (plasmid) [Klebsiella pneumoniae]|uniref:hypothetical protein n=1 Tax=Klebsiella pneumoniae TaxID=573 RepID=UPI001FACEDA5|nr:hypothetical protein [Klebsiella pneumoniae]MCI8109136.1 hypothetical protein [Klebsiella pneumoniae]